MGMYGSHLSVAGGLVNALVDAQKLKLDTVQIFTKNQRQWTVPPLDPAAAADWLGELKRLQWADRTVAHDSYLINLASPSDELWEKSIASMREEIERCEALSIPMLVSHPGAHMIKEGGLTPEERVEAGLVRIAKAYKRLLRETRGYRVTICLENTAGGGTTLGRTLNELARLRELILSEAGSDADLKGAKAAGGRIGFCLDTCHALAAGYDLAARSTGGSEGKKRTIAEGAALGRAFLDEVEQFLGLARVRAMHLNDSIGARGSRIDRHAHIGQGNVSLGVFGAIVNEPRLSNTPLILETPKEEDESGTAMDTINLRTLARAAKQTQSL